MHLRMCQQNELPMTKNKTIPALWGGCPLHLLVLCGAPNSGKSWLATHIAPERTLYLDSEKSGTAYQTLVKKYIDIRAATRARIARAPTPRDLFDTVRLETDQIALGEFEVVAIDVFSGTLEQGIVELVAGDYAKYGFTTEAKFTASGGLFWSRVRGFVEEFILELSDRCTTLVLTTQLKTIWRDGRATKDQEPKGKTSVYDLAAMYLLLERKSITRHAPPSPIPTAQVLKSHTLHPFPPRLPEATYNSILHYLTAGGNYGTLTEEESIKDAQLTADEKLQLQATIEETKLEAATAELERAKIDERVGVARAEALKKLQNRSLG